MGDVIRLIGPMSYPDPDISLNVCYYLRHTIFVYAQIVKIRARNEGMQEEAVPSVGAQTAGVLIGKTSRTVQRWCEEGRLPAVSVDRRGTVRIPLTALVPFISIPWDDGRSQLAADADRGDMQAQSELALIFLEANEPLIAVYWFQAAATRGCADAMCWLSDCYIKGLGVPKDHHRALRWLADAAIHGHPLARAQLRSLGHGE